MNPRSTARSGPWRRRAAAATAVIVLGTLIQGVTQPAAAVDDGSGRPGLPVSEKPVPGKRLDGGPLPVAEDHQKGPRPAPDAAWPKATTATVTLPTAAAARATAPVRPRGVPLELDTRLAAAQKPLTGAVETRVLDRAATRAAGVDGVVLSLRPTAAGADGRVRAHLDYSAFADAFGGGYASRLTLAELPACALTTPAAARCRTVKPLAAVNDTEKRRITATGVRLRAGAPTVLATITNAAGAKGDYKATSLTAASTWSTSLNTGDFSWSHPMPAPEVPGGLKPELALSYSSGGVDGRTGNTNNQSSWAGDGFDLSPGFIERRYKPCADDGVENAQGHKPGDLCWGYDNAYISLNGKGGELVPTGANTFKLREDDGTRIERLTHADRANGDNDNEYWKVTLSSGTQYHFGYHRLPGWATGKETTDSTWTVPVYGDDAGEECKGTTFATSWCQQAWRWNLDYVVDPHGNAMAYYYTKETNHYGRNLEPTDDTPYVRGGTLDRIEYGLPKADLYATKALAKVDLTSAERCLATPTMDCSNIGTQATYWYDTPWDLNCAAGTTCDKGRLSPAFFTRKRLTDVTTEVLDGTAYKKIDSWKLTHDWGMADTDYQLRLRSVQRTGHSATPAITQPKTTLGYTQLANRLDKVEDGFAPFIKDRLSSVVDESGGQVDVTYSAPVCSWTALPTPETNTTRCFPQKIGGTDTEAPTTQWFNKYVVSSLTETDTTGLAADKVSTYEYLGGGAWHYDDDDGLTKEKHKTWSQWRGYGQVRVKTGNQGGAAAMKTQEDTYFLRGMHGDRLNATGGEKSVSVTLGEGEGAAITDHEPAAGFAYKTVQYSGPGGGVLGKTVNRPWHHQTASRTRTWGTITANFTGTSHTKTFTSLDNGAGTSWRTASHASTFDTVAGRVTEVDDHGDNSTGADNTCTRTTYAPHTTANILGLTSRVETVSQACGDPVARPADVMTDVRTAYDSTAYGEAATKGDVTASAILQRYDGTTAVYQESGTTYDAYGRKLAATDITADVKVTAAGALTRTARTDGRTTTTSYTPASGYATSSTVTTPRARPTDAASFQTNTTTFDVSRGLPLTQTDTNGKVTHLTHDALGRSSKVWLADRLTGQTPTYEFVYHPAGNQQPIAVATKTLNTAGSAQRTSYTLYDGFLRPRQTQDPGPNGGTLIADSFYDDRGLLSKEFASYYVTSAPSTTLFQPANALSVETQNRHTYDGLNRQTELRQIAGNSDGGQVLNITKTVYGGDRTTVIPPTGGTATTTLVDARGRTTALREHHQPTVGSTFDTTAFAHTPRGEVSRITDPGGSFWTYSYDLLGRQKVATDPDKGTTTNTYDDRGQLETAANDATGITLAYVYDGLGRKTALHTGSPTGPKRAEWKYDTITGAKGQLAESVRHENSQQYVSKVIAYDRLYRPLRTSVTIPPHERELQGTYQSVLSYTASGQPENITYPAAGALPGTAVSLLYDEATLRPTSVDTANGVKALPSYSLTGKPLQYELYRGTGKKTWVTNGYEWGTQRLSTTRVDRENVAGVDQSNTYRYDDAGNVHSVTDVSRSGTDSQCFTYDWARRLTQAWTQSTATCATAPSTTNVGGPAPYWHSYAYDIVGNRTSETLHDPTGDTAKNVQRAYAYPGAGQPKPHSLTSVTATGPGGVSSSYDYVAGNTTRRTVGATTQNLVWDAEGRLAKVTEPVPNEAAKVTEYLYDAEGNRLIGRTPTETTLYLGTTEITLPKGTTVPTATRYIALGGGHQAVQENDGSISFTLADHHGTAQLATDAATQALSQRRTLPFGGTRGTQPTDWPGTKGFVGGTDDTKSTGLNHLGAREYDPSTGRFISVDPIMETDKPQTLNGYTYGAQNPLTFTDPSGLGLACGGGMEACPTRPDGTRGNGRPNEAVPPSVWVKKENQRTYEAAVNYPGPRKPPPPSNLPPMLKGPEHAPAYQTDNRSWYEKSWDVVSAGAKAAVIPDVDGAKNCWNAGGRSMDCVGLVGEIPFFKLAKGKKVYDGVNDALKGGKGRKLDPDCECFPAGTTVLMANGTTKAIEDIKEGDEVQAKNPETGESGPRPVTDLIRTEDDKHFNTLSIATEDGIDHLTATHEHPFWSPSENTWLTAGDLDPGMTLLTDEGKTVVVTGNKVSTQQVRTYNFTVADLHTYYVLAGATPVLVHNSTCPVTSVIHDDSFLVKAAEAAGKNERIQKEIDDLVLQFRSGNTNPGLGNKSLEGTDVSYLRGRNGARVFFRNTSEGMQIVGKANKANEPKVISRLKEKYGN
ncbi:polymorphic toxin-type HINT domain-containing protein [Streptomyces sp. NPDC057638]|uniref:polymorphic toxin-type HINT domain-containing protein n=1 Tax=Streptomyces sp. NPDC057638 TaxID=3346190 RepID=UPI0036B7ADF4